MDGMAWMGDRAVRARCTRSGIDRMRMTSMDSIDRDRE